ncbi:MAG: chemotaxis response regulator protein-glutamate methylesterase [Rhodothermaceae bacterium]|nr:chemotaxis response regulator protein-glutamate methylesterase [Rhodothermaceae bacterium]
MGIKILIVDDSVLARRLISSALEEEPALEVVGTAVNGVNALKKVELLKPDLVIMDVEMPEMDGVEALKVIKQRHPNIAVIMFTSLSEASSEKTLEALESGAEDYVAKPTGANGVEEVKMLTRSSLVPKIMALRGNLRGSKAEPSNKVDAPAPSSPPHPAPPRRFTSSTPPVRKPEKAETKPVKPAGTPTRLTTNKLRAPVKILVIGVSTGGPNALAKLIPTIPASIPVPVLIVQHMPAAFTTTLAKRLDGASDLSVKEARAGEVVTPGVVRIAPGGFHMIVEKKGGGVVLNLNEDPPEQGCRPAVDVLFRSVAEVYGKHALAVILTGMGKDGLNGSEAIIDQGGSLFAQDEASSVVWGMPGAVTRAGLVDKVIPLDRIGYEIMLRIETTLAHTNH